MGVALAGLAIAWAVMLTFGGLELDRGLLILAQAGERPGLERIAAWITFLGGATVLLPATGLGACWLLVRREAMSAALLIGLTLSGRLLVSLQKDWAARIRPDPAGHLVPVESLSFPSGHAANAAMVWLALALLIARTPRSRSIAVWVGASATLLVGASRVILGVHWPTDVIGGWAFGLFWTLLLLHLSGRSLSTGTSPGLRHYPGEGGTR